MSGSNKTFHDFLVRPYPTYSHLSSTESFDAIIVPQARLPERIHEAVSLAHELGARLISLCSHKAEASYVADFIDNYSEYNSGGPYSWCAVNVPPDYSIPKVDLVSHKEIPEFASQPEGSNLSDKRNIGLAIGRMIGAQRLLFLDDDIKMSADTARSVSSALRDNDIAGPKCTYYPDNSAFIHVKGAIEEFHMPTQRVEYRGRGNGSVYYSGPIREKSVTTGMLSGNSLAVNPQAALEHFPRQIYNEDWFMMYNTVHRGRALMAPNCECYQRKYNPFIPDRARREEFGDIIAVGLYENFRKYSAADSRPPAAVSFADPRYWNVMIRERQNENFEMMEAIGAERNLEYFNVNPDSPKSYPKLMMDSEQQKILRNTLEAGLEVSQLMDGDMIVNYLRAWRQDQRRWASMAEQLPSDKKLMGALARLGLDGGTFSSTENRYDI